MEYMWKNCNPGVQSLAFNTEVLWSWKGTKKLEMNEL